MIVRVVVIASTACNEI